MTVIPFEYVHIPTLIKLRAAAQPAPAPYVPQAGDVVEWVADEHVQNVVLPSQLEG